MDTLQDITTNYVQNLPIYDVFQDQIEKVEIASNSSLYKITLILINILFVMILNCNILV